jgi:5S rRNA maturation endonuclease (ribonuclease M5)
MSAYVEELERQLGELPEDYQILIKQLKKIHKRVKITRNSASRDLILRFPSPYALDQDGLKETRSIHGAINLTYYFEKNGHEKNYGGRCLKYDQIRYKMSELLNMPSLDQRGYKNVQSVLEGFLDTTVLIQDANGNWIPKPPGKCTPLTALPEGHAALEYVLNRGFDPEKLYAQFRASYCYEEYWDEQSYYKRLPYGFKFSPQGRIIFFMDMHGVQKGWQGRLIEKEENGVISYWQPYDDIWVPVKYRMQGEVLPLDPKNDFKIMKYNTGKGSKKTETFMGFDAAVKSEHKHAIIVEGVLDAARLGVPGMSVQGKTLSDIQATLLADNFEKVFVIGDNDHGGKNLVEQVVSRMIMKSVPVEEIEIPHKYNDVGEMPQDEVDQLLKEKIKWD